MPNIISIIIITIGGQMKNFGFTLAETLITLGIIGVIAAITIPTINTRITHKKLHSQFKKTYSELNQAARAFYADTDIPVHDYDVILKGGTDGTENFYTISNKLLEKFLSYYNGSIKDKAINWDAFDIQHEIKSLNLNGQSIRQYPCDRSSVFTDTVGRMYILDDSSTAYSTHKEYGPKICVDINGIDRPNRWGYDRFVFVFTENNSVIPYTGNSWAALEKNITDPAKIAKNCSKSTSTPNHACAYFALSNQSPTGNGSYWYDFLIRNK